ncbi:TraR/DksA C4-type zinc finger protein [Shinella sp. G-2]|uniref:TraR/DksA C4-type zinc finger protein n=1 Tax=Shinella sp. G-2 TaxID=3133141 RepID=UPI003D00CA67
MSNFEDRLAHADERVTAERQAEIARAGAALAALGTADCQMCGEPISAARREALPSARRCLQCQIKADRRRKGR